MKTTKIVIKNLFGIKETELDGRSVEISGPKGSGKTSVLDSIRYALTNRSDRDYIVHRGADEGEIIIETDTGLSIDRKALPAKSAGTVKVRDGSLLQTRPAEFLSQIFTPLQLNPVEFTQLSRQEKNRVILNLIEFAWDTNWIREQFGEIPQGVDYSKHILEVLHDIQAENGVYFQSRQNINRDIRNKQAFVSDIAKDIPSGYDFDHWNTYPIGEKYRKLIAAGSCFAEGEEVIDYGFVERWILGLEEKYGVEVMQVGYDRYNAISTVQKLEANSMECVEVKQHSSVLHPPTKLLREAILKKEFAYDENRLLEINFQNARCTEDTNLNKYVNKKRSAGKVDMVVSTIIAVYLMQQAMLDNSELDWGIQVI